MTDVTYDENKGGRVLKTDVLGRVKTDAGQRESILDEFERSGLSGTKFAAVTGVKYQTFASWVQRRRRATGAYLRKSADKKTTGSAAPMPALGWMEAVVDKRTGLAASHGVLRLELPGGASVEMANELQAALAGHLLRAWHAGNQPRSC